MSVEVDQAGQDHAAGVVDPHALRFRRLNGLDLLARTDDDMAVLDRLSRRQDVAAERNRLGGGGTGGELELSACRRCERLGDRGVVGGLKETALGI